LLRAGNFKDRSGVFSKQCGSFSYFRRRLYTAVHKAPPLKYGIGHMRRFSSLCQATPVLPEPTLMFRPAIRKNDGALLFSFPICQLPIADLRQAVSLNPLGSGARPSER
jgi:hypothetical protein